VTSRASRMRGMTLMELLVSMTLLAALGALIVQLMRNSFDLYSAGERRGEYAVDALAVLDRFDDDLRDATTTREGRFVLEQRGGDGVTAPVFLLRMTRTPPGGEMGHSVLRRAGTRPEPVGIYRGGDPGPESRPVVGPPANLMEVAYALLQDPHVDAGILTLYRGERAPAYQPGASFFDAEAAVHDPKWIRDHMTPVAAGVLGLKLLCRGPETDDWDEVTALEGRGAADGALVAWDSTRGLLGGDAFRYAIGPESVDEPRDDLFPSHVRAVLTMGRAGVPDATTGKRLAAGQKDLTVNRPERLPLATDEDRLVKIGSEWLEIEATESWGARVLRGRRRSDLTAQHDVGAPVWVGKTFRKTYELPASAPPILGAVR